MRTQHHSIEAYQSARGGHSRVRRGFTTASLAFCAGCLAVAWGLQAQDPGGDRILEARRIILQDPEGKGRLVLEVSELGPVIRFLDAQGHARIVLGNQLFPAGAEDESEAEVVTGLCILGQDMLSFGPWKMPRFVALVMDQELKTGGLEIAGGELSAPIQVGIGTGRGRPVLEMGRSGVGGITAELTDTGLALRCEDYEGTGARLGVEKGTATVEVYREQIGPAGHLTADQEGAGLSLFSPFSFEPPLVFLKAGDSGPLLRLQTPEGEVRFER